MATTDRITPRALTLGHLAVELDCDRRTLAKALHAANTEVVTTIQGQPAWTVRQALDALAKRAEHDRRLRRFDQSPSPPPFGAEILAEIPDHGHAGLTIGLLSAIYATPRLVRGLAPRCGCNAKQAGELAMMVTLALVDHAERQLRATGVAPFVEDDGPNWINLGCMAWWPPDKMGEAAA